MRQQPLQWHPAFQAVMQIELAEYQDWLKYSALPKKENVWLSRLRPGLDVEEDIAMLAQAYQRRDENPLYSAVMELIVRANRKQYEEAKHMCNALRELFAEEIEEGRQRAIVWLSLKFSGARWRMENPWRNRQRPWRRGRKISRSFTA